MRIHLLLALALAANACAQSNTFPQHLLSAQGNSANRINILVMGEGWTQAEIDSGAYGQKADELIRQGLLQKEPYKSYANLLQIWRIDVPSAQSGVGDQIHPLVGEEPASPGPNRGQVVGTFVGTVLAGPVGGLIGGQIGRRFSGTGPSGDPNSPLYSGETDDVTQTAADPGAQPSPSSSPPPSPSSSPPPGGIGGRAGGTAGAGTGTGSTGISKKPQPTASAPPGPPVPPGLACKPPDSAVRYQTRMKDTYFGVWRKERTVDGAKQSGNIVWFANSSCAVERMRNVNPNLRRHIVILVLNDTNGRGAALYTGTSDFGYTCVPIHDRRFQTVSHEAGHCLVNLADEYVDASLNRPAPTSEPDEVNVTILNDPARVKWADWIRAGEPGIGLVEGGKYVPTGVWRPKDTCQMREHNKEFCAICYEATLQRFYSAVSLIDASTPSGFGMLLSSGASQQFRVNTVGPLNGKIEGEWTLDGAVLKGTKTDSATGPIFELTLGPDKLVAGIHLVKFVAVDRTPALLGNGTGSSQASARGRRPNQRIWIVAVRQTNGQPRLTAVPVTE